MDGVWQQLPATIANGCWLGDQSRVPLRLALAGSLIGTPGLQCCTENVWLGAGMPLAGGFISEHPGTQHALGIGLGKSSPEKGSTQQESSRDFEPGEAHVSSACSFAVAAMNTSRRLLKEHRQERLGDVATVECYQ